MSSSSPTLNYVFNFLELGKSVPEPKLAPGLYHAMTSSFDLAMVKVDVYKAEGGYCGYVVKHWLTKDKLADTLGAPQFIVPGPIQDTYWLPGDVMQFEVLPSGEVRSGHSSPPKPALFMASGESK